MKYKTGGIMQRIAKFYKVSFEQFQADWADTFPDTPAERIREIYEDIRLPRRATSGSAGYDFFTLTCFCLKYDLGRSHTINGLFIYHKLYSRYRDWQPGSVFNQNLQDGHFIFTFCFHKSN